MFKNIYDIAFLYIPVRGNVLYIIGTSKYIRIGEEREKERDRSFIRLRERERDHSFVQERVGGREREREIVHLFKREWERERVRERSFICSRESGRERERDTCGSKYTRVGRVTCNACMRERECV